jgi:hypothetical protein
MSCRCRAGSAAIAVAKSGVEGGGQEQCLRNHLRGGKQGSSDRQKRAVGTPLNSLGPALVANSLCRELGKPMMRDLEIQIGNSGWNDQGCAGGKSAAEQFGGSRAYCELRRATRSAERAATTRGEPVNRFGLIVLSMAGLVVASGGDSDIKRADL